MKSIRLFLPAIAFLFLSTSIVTARSVRLWSYQELFDKSDLVVVATPRTVKDFGEQRDHPQHAGEPVTDVETAFAISLVLKGDKNLKGIILHHYRGKMQIPNAPTYVSFDPAEKRTYVLFLVREADGRYAPVVGQTDPGMAIRPEPIAIKKPEEIGFKHSSFTFARIRYSSLGRSGTDSRWATDYPDADKNFSRRFQEVTGLKSDTNGMVLELTDSRLRQQPFIYLVEGGQMQMTPEEVEALRRYLLNGGFLMVDDFWGDTEWEAVAAQFRRVFPDREPIELPLDHPIFHSFYLIHTKPQVPSVTARDWKTGVTSDRPDAREAHYRGLVDANGRLMVVFCHNTDLGDGWEEEATDPVYFEEFSQKRAFPMGINIVVYALSQ